MTLTSKIPPHVDWLIDTKERLTTADGLTVEVWEINHQSEEKILSAWANYLFSHYSTAEEIEQLRDGSRLSRAEYLLQYIFPDKSEGFGPATRSGDFAEILIADFVEFVQGYWVPRNRYDHKDIPNESEKGTDVIGLKIIDADKFNPEDTLLAIEVKAQFSGNKPNLRLQDAVNGSTNDPLRIPLSINAAKRRLLAKKNPEAKLISRFQNLEDKPYQTIYGAAALFSSNLFDKSQICSTDCQKHPGQKNLILLIIRGPEMMKLVHDLYEKAANEA